MLLTGRMFLQVAQVRTSNSNRSNTQSSEAWPPPRVLRKQRTMKRILTYLIPVALIALALSCTSEGSGDGVGDGDVVTFKTTLAGSRGAILIEKDDEQPLLDPLQNTAIGGGSFSTLAYLSDNGNCYIDNAWVHFFAGGTNKWQFRDDGGTPANLTDDRYVDYYWPKGHDVNFFTYMPYKQALANTHVTIGTHTIAAGPAFSCDLPMDNGQDSMQEFIYAYATNQNKVTQGTDGVELRFVHPFAAVEVWLKQSYRMTIKNISFSNLYNKGTYTNAYSTVDFGGDAATNFTHNNWQPSGTPSALTIAVNEDVPSSAINFNSKVGGPYIVMPQALDGVEFTIEYSRDDVPDDSKSITVKTVEVPAWEPGKRYRYNITLGDPEEEILFNVLVDEWEVIEYKNEFDVE